jgi:hypothetical protein
MPARRRPLALIPNPVPLCRLHVARKATLMSDAKPRPMGVRCPADGCKYRYPVAPYLVKRERGLSCRCPCEMCGGAPEEYLLAHYRCPKCGSTYAELWPLHAPAESPPSVPNPNR